MMTDTDNGDDGGDNEYEDIDDDKSQNSRISRSTRSSRTSGTSGTSRQSKNSRVSRSTTTSLFSMYSRRSRKTRIPGGGPRSSGKSRKPTETLEENFRRRERDRDGNNMVEFMKDVGTDSTTEDIYGPNSLEFVVDLLHPTLAACFYTKKKHLFGHEERLSGYLEDPDLCMNLVSDEFIIHNGHYTESLLHYFASLRADPDFQDDKGKRILKTINYILLRRINVQEYMSMINNCSILAHTEIDETCFEWTSICKEKRGCDNNILCRIVCYRLAVLLMARNIIESKKPGSLPVLVNNIYAHVDSHMPALCKIYRDKEESPSMKCSQRKFETIIEMTPFSVDYAYTTSTVPDMSRFLSYSMIYNNVINKLESKAMIRCKMSCFDEYNAQILEYIMDVMNKLTPHKCNIRQFFSPVENVCKNSSVMREFVCMLIVASWLGVYEISKFKAPVNSRVGAYMWFHGIVQKSEFNRMIHRSHTFTLYAMFKEYFQHIVYIMPGMDQVMKEMYAWEKYCLYTREMTKEIRKMINHNINTNGYSEERFCNIFNGIRKVIEPMHNAFRTSQYGKKVDNCIGTIMHICNDYNLKNYEIDNTKRIIPGKEYLHKDPHPSIPPEKEKLMDSIIKSFGASQRVPMDWLIAFGPTRSQILTMKRAVISSYPKFRNKIANMDKRAYAYFYTFFKLVAANSAIRVFNGDINMYLTHFSVAKERFGIENGGLIPKCVGRLQVCTNCMQVKKPTFVIQKPCVKAHGGSGETKVSIMGKVVCAEEVRAADWKEKHKERTGRAPKTLGTTKYIRQSKETLVRTVAKKVSKQRTRLSCGKKEITQIDALGKLVYFAGKLYTGCFICLYYIKMRDAVFCGNMILCPACARTTTQNVEKHKKLCEICCKKPSGKPYEFFLFDDDEYLEPDEQDYRKMYFCSKGHGRLNWVITHGIMRRSLVIKGIINEWNTMGSDGKFIPVGGRLSEEEEVNKGLRNVNKRIKLSYNNLPEGAVFRSTLKADENGRFVIPIIEEVD